MEAIKRYNYDGFRCLDCGSEQEFTRKDGIIADIQVCKECELVMDMSITEEKDMWKKSFRELCIDLAKKQKVENEKEAVVIDAEFAEKAKKEIRRVLSVDLEYYLGGKPFDGHITVTRTVSRKMTYEVEGIIFTVTPTANGLNVKVLNHCDICGQDWESFLIGSKADVGKAILEKHPQYDCEKHINIPPQSLGDKLEEIIREIVSEHGD